MKVFHAFRLDTLNHALWRGDERVSLAPKAFDVLRYLVEHSDRLVTQEEILEALWPETYVNPEVVKKYVLGIRKVLGDNTDKPVFVATFPRRGYQFIAPVSDEGALPLPDVMASGIRTIVGRDGALAQLEDALNKAQRGQRQIVFVTGEAGIGKTTLLDVFQQTAIAHAKVRIARGQCVEGFGGKEAYYPILEALGQLFRETDDAPSLQTFSKRAPTWLVQFPDLIRADQREILEKQIIGATRERMVREICEALEMLTAQNPLVLCLEDLHWVDSPTLDFISALARRRGPAKLLLLGTYRPADVIISQSPLKALKQDLTLHNLSYELALERLEESDVEQYLAIEFAGGVFPPGFANVVYRHSGGNALFMVTILQDMVKARLIAQVEGKWELTTRLEEVEPSVPETLDQLIEAQFQHLSAVEQRILRTASVAGDLFSVWGIATAVEMEEHRIEDACEGLAERLQFLKCAGTHELTNGEFSPHYEFRHSLYREVLYRRLSESTRSKLHRLLAERLEALCDPCEMELAAELAVHCEEGREYDQAIRYLILVAENAAGRFAYNDSIEILCHAHELTAKLDPQLRAESEIQILELVGDAHYTLGAMADSAESYAAAASVAEQAGLLAAHVRLLTRLMNPCGFIDPARGLAAMEQAVGVSATVGDPLLLARTQMLAATFRLVFDKWSQQDADLCASAYEAVQRLGDPGTRAYMRLIHAHVLTLQGNYREALDVFEAAISRTEYGSGAIAQYIAVLGKSQVLLRTGQLGEVLRISRSERKLAEKNGSAPWLFDFREAWVRTLVFDFTGALQICQSIGEPTAAYLAGQLQTINRIAEGTLALNRGEYDRAIEQFGQVRDREITPTFLLSWIWRLTAQLLTGDAWLLSGNISQARTEADSCLESALSTADPHAQALAWDLQARVAMAENDWAGARESIQQALAIVDKFAILVAEWQTQVTAWQFYEHVKEHDAAETHRERAEACILKIADSFEPDEPLRATFLAAAPVRRMLREQNATKATQPRDSRRGAAS